MGLRTSPGGGESQSGAAASDPRAAQAARAALVHGNAVDAVAAGVLVAAAHSPGVYCTNPWTMRTQVSTLRK